jgi:alpha-amylase
VHKQLLVRNIIVLVLHNNACYMQIKNFVCAAILLLAACTAQQPPVTDGHPTWALQGNIYEVNIRQYTPEGTLNAFATHLNRLKEMGVQTLWFMPVHPVGVTDRKGALGSYYAVQNYTAVNPEFGTLDDWKALVKRSHKMGFKIIIDWVANHTAADHDWLKTHPDFYVRDSAGNAIAPFDWTDVRKLNYNNMAMQDSMIQALRFWVQETDIDGFRCDVAEEVPASFWKRAIDSLKKNKNVFMLAEGNAAWLHDAGFDQSYAWDEFSVLKKVATGEKTAKAIDSALTKLDTGYAKNTLRLYFTSNHDENTWNKADYATMPGNVHAPFAVLTQTMARSIPLIYSGQEEPFLDSLSFFYKDTIAFGKYQRAEFYRTLLNLRKANPALAANAEYRKLTTNQDDAIFAYQRSFQQNRVVVILNLSNKPVQFNFQDAPLTGNWRNVFTGKTEPPSNGMQLEPWAYRVYETRSKD